MSASRPASPAAAPARPCRLTAIVVQGGKLGGLVAAASAVASPHAQLVPRGLPQLGQKHLPGAVGAQALPGPGALGPVLQHDGGDGAAPVVPALQVKPSMRGVDVGEEVLVPCIEMGGGRSEPLLAAMVRKEKKVEEGHAGRHSFPVRKW